MEHTVLTNSVSCTGTIDLILMINSSKEYHLMVGAYGTRLLLMVLYWVQLFLTNEPHGLIQVAFQKA